MEESLRIIISGGGTGGHIFPAVSIANALKEQHPDIKILFVGAENRMEMQRVPAAGYDIIGLPVEGLDRKRLWRNFRVLYKLFLSQLKARKIIKDFRPHAAVGVGGYASGPLLKAAASAGIPTLLQEQNSYAGVTNKLLAKTAKKICVAYEGMDKFFPKEKIILTGNPVRQGLLQSKMTREEAIASFGLNPTKKTILVVGGSLGARTLNRAMTAYLKQISEGEIQFIWQTGKFYIDDARRAVESIGTMAQLHVTDFISDMVAAYRAADLVISRAGASSISELCLLQKPVILVPSPNVAEDHQTKNALALVHKDAAVYVKDLEAERTLVPTALEVVNNGNKLQQLSKNIVQLAYHDSANVIAREVYELAVKYQQEHGR